MFVFEIGRTRHTNRFRALIPLIIPDGYGPLTCHKPPIPPRRNSQKEHKILAVLWPVPAGDLAVEEPTRDA